MTEPTNWLHEAEKHEAKAAMIRDGGLSYGGRQAAYDANIIDAAACRRIAEKEKRNG